MFGKETSPNSLIEKQRIAEIASQDMIKIEQNEYMNTQQIPSPRKITFAMKGKDDNKWEQNNNFDKENLEIRQRK